MGACPSPSSHRGQLREYSQGLPAALTRRARQDGRPSQTRSTSEPAAATAAWRSSHAALVSAAASRNTGCVELLEDPVRGREAGVADLHDEVELPSPGVEEGLLRRSQLRRAGPGLPRASTTS